MRRLRLGRILVFTCFSLVSACAGNIGTSGYLKIKFQRPQAFQLQFIPPDTQRFNVIVSGIGIPENDPVELSISLGQAEKVQILKMPIGQKTVSVVALGELQKVLASGKSTIQIEGGKLNQAEVILQAIETPFILPEKSQLVFEENLRSAPVIAAFAPIEGKAGSIVYITGKNFDLRPANNQVFFHGVQAKVVNRTDQALIVEVPQGVRSGPIELLTPGGKTTTKTAFSVADQREEPLLEDFEPKSAPAGQSVTIKGRNFDLLNPEKNVVTFNNIQAKVLSVDSSALVALVPAGATSGFIKITNRFGTGVSPVVFKKTD